MQGYHFEPHLYLKNRSWRTERKEQKNKNTTKKKNNKLILLGPDFLEVIFWIIVVCLCDIELARLLSFRGGVGCLNCLDFYFLEVDPAELWAASAVGPRGKLARGSFSSEIVCAARLLKETNTICQAQTR